MASTISHPFSDGRTAHITFTGTAEGDLRIDGEREALARRRAELVGRPWTWLRQMHGREVVTVTSPGGSAGEPADGAVTEISGAVLAVHTADCAPVALLAAAGAVGVAHAGWRGVAAGVLGEAVARLRDLSGGPVTAYVGPLIGPECYEFGAEDLAQIVAVLGQEVVGRTSAGRPALDLPAAVRSALVAAGVEDMTFVGGCTACGKGSFSHRARGDVGRQAALAWIDEAG